MLARGVSLCSDGVTKGQGTGDESTAPVTVWADLSLWNTRWLIMESQWTGDPLIWFQSPGRCLLLALCLQTYCLDILPPSTPSHHAGGVPQGRTGYDISSLDNGCTYASEIHTKPGLHLHAGLRTLLPGKLTETHIKWVREGDKPLSCWYTLSKSSTLMVLHTIFSEQTNT